MTTSQGRRRDGELADLLEQLLEATGGPLTDDERRAADAALGWLPRQPE